jgi:hypothetical protein
LRSSVAKARQQGILPYTSLSDPEPEPDATPSSDKNNRAEQPTLTKPFPWNTPIHNPCQSGLDQLAQVGQVADLADDSGMWLNDFNFASWFPGAGSSGE